MENEDSKQNLDKIIEEEIQNLDQDINSSSEEEGFNSDSGTKSLTDKGREKLFDLYESNPYSMAAMENFVAGYALGTLGEGVGGDFEIAIPASVPTVNAIYGDLPTDTYSIARYTAYGAGWISSQMDKIL